jgi:hypothetical protein
MAYGTEAGGDNDGSAAENSISDILFGFCTIKHAGVSNMVKFATNMKRIPWNEIGIFAGVVAVLGVCIWFLGRSKDNGDTTLETRPKFAHHAEENLVPKTDPRPAVDSEPPADDSDTEPREDPDGESDGEVVAVVADSNPDGGSDGEVVADSNPDGGSDGEVVADSNPDGGSDGGSREEDPNGDASERPAFDNDFWDAVNEEAAMISFGISSPPNVPRCDVQRFFALGGSSSCSRTGTECPLECASVMAPVLACDNSDEIIAQATQWESRWGDFADNCRKQNSASDEGTAGPPPMGAKHHPIDKDTDEPSTESGKPQSSNDEPSTESGKPQSSNEKPSTESGKPQSSNDEPSTESGKPQSSNEKPSTESGKPQSSNEKPSTDSVVPTYDVQGCIKQFAAATNTDDCLATGGISCSADCAPHINKWVDRCTMAPLDEFDSDIKLSMTNFVNSCQTFQ